MLFLAVSHFCQAFLVDPILLISSIGTFGEPPSSFSRSDTAGDTSGSSSSSSSSSSTWVLQAQQYEIYKFDVSRQVVSNSTVLYADSLAEFEAQARLLFRPGQLSSLVSMRQYAAACALQLLLLRRWLRWRQPCTFPGVACN